MGLRFGGRASGGLWPGSDFYQVFQRNKQHLVKVFRMKEIIEVPVLSEAARRLGLPLSIATRANGFVFVSGTPPFDLTVRRTSAVLP